MHGVCHWIECGRDGIREFDIHTERRSALPPHVCLQSVQQRPKQSVTREASENLSPAHSQEYATVVRSWRCHSITAVARMGHVLVETWQASLWTPDVQFYFMVEITASCCPWRPTPWLLTWIGLTSISARCGTGLYLAVKDWSLSVRTVCFILPFQGEALLWLLLGSALHATCMCLTLYSDNPTFDHVARFMLSARALRRTHLAATGWPLPSGNGVS